MAVGSGHKVLTNSLVSRGNFVRCLIGAVGSRGAIRFYWVFLDSIA